MVPPVETGMVAAREPVTELLLESPAGPIPVRAEVRGGKVTGVTFENVPGFAVHLDAPIEVPQLGKVIVDVAYGGMFYVIADAEPLGLRLVHPDSNLGGWLNSSYPSARAGENSGHTRRFGGS